MTRPSLSDAAAALREAEEIRVRAWRVVDPARREAALRVAARAQVLAELLTLAAGGDREALVLLRGVA